MQFQRATKAQARLRMALIGPSGAGKTYSALAIAEGLGDRIAVIDTERGSASKYARRFGFDVLELTPPFGPLRYVEAIHIAEAAGYPVLIIDSLSHAWTGAGGALDLVDKEAVRSGSNNTFAAWRNVTPLHNQMVDAILGSGAHVIVTLRAKQEYVQEKDAQGRTVIRKVGLQPVQRDGLEYEFDIVGDLDMGNRLIVGKSRCEEMTGAIVEKPGRDVGVTLLGWLSDGEAPPPRKPTSGEAMTMDDWQAKYQTGMRAVNERGLDAAAYELNAGADAAAVEAMVRKMGAAVNAFDAKAPAK